MSAAPRIRMLALLLATIAAADIVALHAAKPRKRRGSIGGESLTRSLSVSLDDRLRALSNQHGVTAGAIARECIEAGLRAVMERLRRAARKEARNGSTGGPEA